MVHASHPYSNVGYLRNISVLFSYVYIKVSILCVLSLWISLSHLASEVNRVSRLTTDCTGSRTFPCTMMLQVGLLAVFENITVNGLELFLHNPVFSLSTTTKINYCSCCSDSVIVPVSSTNLRLLITVPPILNPSMSSTFLVIISREATHPWHIVWYTTPHVCHCHI